MDYFHIGLVYLGVLFSLIALAMAWDAATAARKALQAVYEIHKAFLASKGKDQP